MDHLTGRQLRSGFLTIAVGAGVISGCATVPRNAGFQEVQQVAEQRTGGRVHWNQGLAEDMEAERAVQAMLQESLTVDQAVQIALLNNQALQATFEELGVAQADVVQAGLLKNPMFSGHVRFPNRSEESTNTEFSVSQDFLDIFLVPLRKKLAVAQLEQAKLNVSDAVLRLAAEVRGSYYTLQGMEHAQKMLKTIAQAAQTAMELAERQQAAGNISDLELANQQAAFQQVKLDFTRMDVEVLAARERLNRLMGLEGSPAWKIADKLPELPTTEPRLEDLEAHALSQRFDLATARQEVKVLEQALALTRRGVIPAVNVGADTERDSDGSRVTGPSFEVPLPVFDRRQAERARLQAQFRQSQRRVSSLEIQMRSEVRSGLDRLRVNRQLIERYRDVVIPLREKIVAETQKRYNFMLAGVFQLLQAKREEIQAQREYIEAFRDYWNAWSDLEQAVGGRVMAVAAEAASPTISKPAIPLPETAHPHHHHGGEQ